MFKSGRYAKIVQRRLAKKCIFVREIYRQLGPPTEDPPHPISMVRSLDDALVRYTFSPVEWEDFLALFCTELTAHIRACKIKLKYGLQRDGDCRTLIVWDQRFVRQVLAVAFYADPV